MNTLARRQFLQFLAASPLLGFTQAGRLFAEETLDAIHLPEHLIQSPTEALDVFDFHNIAKQVLPTSHYGYLATGADAVSIGRAYIWGLAAFGQPGVEKVLEMLNAELAMVMGQVGARTISDIGPQHIGR
jgi:hypothetical protein